MVFLQSTILTQLLSKATQLENINGLPLINELTGRLCLCLQSLRDQDNWPIDVDDCQADW